MLDLNIDVFPEDHNGARATSATELSGSSTSSVVNVDDASATVVAGDGDRDSENSTSALNFDIFRKLRTTAQVVPDDDDDEEEVAGNGGRPKFVTWQLFPATSDSGGGGGRALGCEPEFRVESPENKWLNLSVPGSGGSEHSGMRIPPQQQQVRRSRRGPRSRSSQYRGVTFYRRTGRWESHIWDCGKQVYLGGFDTAYAAARAYDRAAIKFRGVDADINFSISDYDEDMKQMKNLSKEEFVQILRRQSTGFSRGNSRYRGVNLHKNGQYIGNKAYDKAAIECNGTINGGGNAHDLDLNLGISTPRDGSRGNKSVGNVHPRPAFYHPIDGNRTMVGGCYYPPPMGLALRGQPLGSDQSAIWQGVPGVSAIHAAGGSRVSSWAWNMQAAAAAAAAGNQQGGGGGGGGSQVVPLFSTTNNNATATAAAASSRFSF